MVYRSRAVSISCRESLTGWCRSSKRYECGSVEPVFRGALILRQRNVATDVEQIPGSSSVCCVERSKGDGEAALVCVRPVDLPTAEDCVDKFIRIRQEHLALAKREFVEPTHRESIGDALIKEHLVWRGCGSIH